MSTAPSVPFVSVDAYLSTEYEISCEYIDGEVIENFVGKRVHSRFLIILGSFLEQLSPGLGFLVYADQHIRISPTRYRVPDLLLMPENHKRESIITEPPLLTIEIASEEEPLSWLTSKVIDHRAMGVKHIVVVDPGQRTVFQFGEDHLLRQLPAPLTLNLDLPKGRLTIDFDALFAKLDY